MLRRGALIVVEGADRVGKSTHAQRLVDTLTERGERVDLIKFPDRTTAIGQLISNYLKGKERLDDHAVHLLFSANRWELMDGIRSTLNSGTSLIVDRYAYSGVAYSAAKPGLALDWCKSPDVGLPKPDLVLYMTLPDEKTLTRAGFGDEIYESMDFQTKVKANYTLLREENWKVINADKSVEELHEELLEIVDKVIEQAAEQPLGVLWVEPKAT
jgi:dTMP kinase